jgi:trimeric autotransporter adhesin
MEGRYMKNIFIALMTALIVSVVGIGYAQPVFEQRSLREVLNPDGTLKQGVQGSFKVEGYTMRIGKNGEPIFLPQLQSAVIGTWDTQFGLPFPGVAGDVYALAIDGNGNVYVGGRFSAVGGVNINVSNVARYNPNSGTWDNLGGGVTSSGGGFVAVYALAVSGNDVYVGGIFNQAGGSSGFNNVARYNPNSGTWDNLGGGVSFGGSGGQVNALAVSGNDVYMGGFFDQAGGSSGFNNVARYNPNSGTWDNLGGGVTSSGGGFVAVYALAVSGNDVYVGGIFNQAGSVSANNVARYNPNSGTWDNLGGGVTSSGGGFAAVYALAVSGNDVYVGGIFNQAGSVSANNVARYDGSGWSRLGTPAQNGVFGQVNALAVSGNDVYVGGFFSQAGSVSANYVARYNPNSGTWDNLGGGVTSSGGGFVAVRALAVSGNDVYVGGFFSQAGTGSGAVFANNVARYDGSGWRALGSGGGNGVNGPVYALAVSGNDVYVGGIFNQAGGSSGFNNVARYNPNSGTWDNLGGGVTSSGGGFAAVYALAVSGSDVYVGGIFNQAGSVSANNVARYDGSGWSRLGTPAQNGVFGQVNALAVSGNDVYVGGFFSQAGSVSANNVARYNPNSGTWDNLGGGVTSSGGGFVVVYALAVSGNDVYVGGVFNQAGSVSANNVARYDGTGWNNLGGGVSFGGSSGVVYALAVSGNDVYVGGFFSQAGSVSANNVARFNVGTNSWRALGTGTQSGVGGVVYALAVSGNDVYVGGFFNLAFTDGSVVFANNVALFSAGSWRALGTGTQNGVDREVRALAVSGNDVYVGGFFNRAGGVPSTFIARFIPTPPNAAATQSVTSDGLVCFSPTGVCINFTGVSGSGTCTVERYDTPPSNVAFSSSAPTNVSRYYFIITAAGFSFTQAELRFNRTQIPNAGIGNPQTVNVYRRPTPGSRRIFSLLPNTFDPSFT